jgi:CheY-like chemotaxis protein
MGGKISVESEANRGSTFTILLPAFQEKGTVLERLNERKAVIASPASAPVSVPKASVAVDDDDDMTAEEKSLISPPTLPKSANTQRSVLVIDDDHSVLELAERILTKEGFRTLMTDNPQTGLQMARTVRPDIIIVDVMLPGSSGWNVLKDIRTDRNCADSKIIMLSVLDERAAAYKAGADGFVSKPLDRDVLIKAFEDANKGNLVETKRAS